MGAVAQIGLLGAGFLLTHLLMSHPPVRRRLVGAVGEWPFRGLYSVVSLALLGPQIAIWWANRHAGAVLWAARGPVATHAAELIVVLGLGLMVGGIAHTPPASMVGPQGKPEARGMAAVTRHPVFMGLSLWALAHLMVNGWLGDVLFYSTWVLTTLLGCWHQDQRLRRDREGYEAYMVETTFLPVPRPRTLGRVGVRGWLGFVGGIGLAIALRLYHEQLFS